MNALQCGRERQSAITQFVHGEKSRDLISIFDNSCFILALFRTHEGDLVREGKELLEKLLFFQINQGEDQGAFPVYLHEYPYCRRPKYSLLTLFALFWISKRYQKVIEKPLRTKLIKSISDLLAYCQKKNFYGGLLALFHALEESITKRKNNILIGPITSSREAAEYLIASQLLEDQDLIQKIWSKVRSYWSKHHMVYVGPCLQEWQMKNEPMVNLLDCFFSKKNLSLQSALVVSSPPEHVPDATFLHDENWLLRENASAVFHSVKKYKPSGVQTNGFSLFRFLWKENDCLCSLACQEKELEYFLLEAAPNRVVMHFCYPKEVKENAFDLAFYLNRHPDISLTTCGKKATVFYVTDGLTIQSKVQKCTLKFQIIEGEGNLMGHIMLGNRPAQKASSMEAYDWKIGLRSISRSLNFTLQVTIESDCLQQDP